MSSRDGRAPSSSTLLNDVFSVFDGLVDASGLEKVKTIGDAYMIVGGMPVWQPDHLERMATLALDIAADVDDNEAAPRLGVRFRIGIHTGPVVAGVIGTQEVHLRRLGRHGECREPDGVDRGARADPGHGGRGGAPARPVPARVARRRRYQGQGSDGDVLPARRA